MSDDYTISGLVAAELTANGYRIAAADERGFWFTLDDGSRVWASDDTPTERTIPLEATP